MLEVITIEQALLRIAAGFDLVRPTEWVATGAALGRRLAQPLVAGFSVPHYRRSTVDGYALRAADVAGAQEASPALLPMAFAVEMGQAAPGPLPPGTCAYVPTGGHVPDGADAMVMVEYTQGFGDDRVIERPAAAGDSIVQIGEDVKEGQVLLEADVRLMPRHFGLLSTLGYAQVPVRPRLKAVVLATGDEIVKPPLNNPGEIPRRVHIGGAEAHKGSAAASDPLTDAPRFGIYDANNALILSTLADWDIEVIAEDYLQDNPEAFKKALEHWNGQADLVLLSGGSSQGVKDLTEQSISALPDAQLLLHGLAIQPGKPTIAGCTPTTLFIGLPGHPGACYTTLKAFVAPLLVALRSNDLVAGLREQQNAQGDSAQALVQLYQRLNLKKATVTVDFHLHGASGRTVYQLVNLTETSEGLVAHAIYGKSGMVGALALADGYVMLPSDLEGYRRGDRATAVYW